jgi:hypothetical protein
MKLWTWTEMKADPQGWLSGADYRAWERERAQERERERIRRRERLVYGIEFESGSNPERFGRVESGECR